MGQAFLPAYFLTSHSTLRFRDPAVTIEFTDDELLAFLDEQLAVDRAAELERILRDSEAMRRRLSEILQRRESGEHSVGEVWRHNRLSCPTRATLGSYVLGVLDGPLADYIQFHLHTIGCRYCQATYSELQQATAAPAPIETRRRRFFESSVGRLRKTDDE